MCVSDKSRVPWFVYIVIFPASISLLTPAVAMSSGISDEDSNTLDTFSQQRMSQEQLQQKLYFLNEHLRNFHGNLPEYVRLGLFMCLG